MTEVVDKIREIREKVKMDWTSIISRVIHTYNKQHQYLIKVSPHYFINNQERVQVNMLVDEEQAKRETRRQCYEKWLSEKKKAEKEEDWTQPLPAAQLKVNDGASTSGYSLGETCYSPEPMNSSSSNSSSPSQSPKRSNEEVIDLSIKAQKIEIKTDTEDDNDDVIFIKEVIQVPKATNHPLSALERNKSLLMSSQKCQLHH